MSDPIALVTDEDISYEEFLDFLRDYGAMLLNPYEGFDGQLVRDGNDVWIAYDNELRELEPDRIAEAARVLGAQPRVQLILEISRAPGSEGLAIEFAHHFAQRWNCLIDNCRSTPDAKLYTRHEILAIGDGRARL